MRNSTPRGFAMVEVVMATAIVGGLTVAALSLAGSSAGHKINAANIARGRVLCRSLAEEISTRPVADWSGAGLDLYINTSDVVVGNDSNLVTIPTATANGTRSGFISIDAYNGYTDSPPQDENGNIIAGYTGWTRVVTVRSARYGIPDLDAMYERGLRRVTVESSFGGKIIASTTFLRSSEWERVQP